MRELSIHHAPQESKLEHFSTRGPIGDAEALESILDAWHEDTSSRAPEFWSIRVLDGLSQLFRGVTASLYQGGADLGGYRTKAKSLLVEIRDLLDQLWWADWPALTSSLEGQIRDLLIRLRETSASLTPRVQQSPFPGHGSRS